MLNKPPLLQVTNLSLSLLEKEKALPLVENISFTLERGQTFALVGESGSGKSLTVSAILGLFSSPLIKITSGTIFFQGKELNDETRRTLIGKKIALIPQNPMSSLNPSLSVGTQLIEHVKGEKSTNKAKALELLYTVGIQDPEKRFYSYPHELSGGMRQRVLIAMGLMQEPDLLLADEPTTALDATTQKEILSLLHTIQKKMGMSILIVTHDLAIVHDIADVVAVMYAGSIVEIKQKQDLFVTPQHPYTKALLKSRPQLEKGKPTPLFVLEGAQPPSGIFTSLCPFVTRCPQAMTICAQLRPELQNNVRCWLYKKEIA
jgi:oligopeptide/dipeptide ABC transporter ATP-binding protein